MVPKGYPPSTLASIVPSYDLTAPTLMGEPRSVLVGNPAAHECLPGSSLAVQRDHNLRPPAFASHTPRKNPPWPNPTETSPVTFERTPEWFCCSHGTRCR